MKQEYISISEFAERAGVSKAYIYKAIKDRLQPYLKEVDNQKRLNIKGLELFDSTKVSTISTNDSTDKDTLKELIEILQEQQETLKAELDIKNEQIKSLNKTIENDQELIKREQEIVSQQQKLQAIAEQKRLQIEAHPQEIPKQESLLNRDKFSTEAEYQQYLLKLLPRIGMFSNRYDLQELDKVLEMMSEYERKLVFRDKRAKEAIEHIKGMDFDQLEKELAEVENEAQEMKIKADEAIRKAREQMEEERAERLNN